jgi:hypothetical protein
LGSGTAETYIEARRLAPPGYRPPNSTVVPLAGQVHRPGKALASWPNARTPVQCPSMIVYTP